MPSNTFIPANKRVFKIAIRTLELALLAVTYLLGHVHLQYISEHLQL